MALLDKLKGTYFKEVQSVVLDLQSGQIGWHAGKKDGDEDKGGEKIATLQKKKGTDKYELVHSPLTEFAVPIPAFAVRTKTDDLKVGDLVVLEDQVVFFIGKGADDALDNPLIRGINVKTGRTADTKVARNTLLGAPAVLAVSNPAAMFGGNGDMSGLLPLLLLGGDKVDSKLLMMLMMMGNKGAEGCNNLLPLLLLGGDKADSKLLMFLMMNQKKGGAEGGINPLLFLLMGNKDKKAGGSDSADLLTLMMMSGGCTGLGNLLPFLGGLGGCPGEPKPAAKV
jgi:hypothetical protein